jgi:hypothetical protein
MALTTDLNPLRNARAAFRAARQALLGAIDDVGTTADTLAQAQRDFAPGRPELADAIAKAAAAVTAATTARGNEKTARANVLTAITNWLAGSNLGTDMARLSTNAPIVLFPVRVETRFDLTAKVLKVRIYPDDIFVNLHEPAITRDEYNAGVAYYKARDAAGGESPELWRQIIGQMPVGRAAYVLRLLTPIFGGGTSGGTGSTGTGTGTTSGIGPEFPTNIMFKPSDFTRPGEAILPDRWIVRAISGSSSTDYVGSPIPEPLAITADPQEKTATELAQVPGTNPALMIDDEIAWTVDYDRAVAAGMAVTIPLTTAQATVGTGGFDRLIVFGVKTTLDSNETTGLLEQLFDGHHYTRGIALVPQGTPTNNTEDNPTPLPADDPDGAVSYQIERIPFPLANMSSMVNLITSSNDGAVLARTLGLHDGLFANVAGKFGLEQLHAKNMGQVIWPATFGYAIEQMMNPIFLPPTPHDNLRNYYLANVRARGPSPVFRIGQVPYGVLPALSVVNWQKRGTSGGETLESSMRDTLLRLRETWKTSALTSVPTVAANSSDPLSDLFRILALYPSARELRIRTGYGQVTELNATSLLNIDFQGPHNVAAGLVNDALSLINQPTWNRGQLSGVVFNDKARIVGIPLVAAPSQLSETLTLPTAALGLLSNLTAAQLVTEPTSPDAVQNTVLYKMARHGYLWALVRSALNQLTKNAALGPFTAVELELLAFTSGSALIAFEQMLVTSTLSFTGGKALGDYGPTRSDSQVQDFIGAVNELAGVPTAELDRLTSETIDLASHRLDAWLTAFATRRLGEMRDAQLASSSAAPVGNYLGGYAFVENVRPVARTTSTLTGFGTVESQLGNGGFVQAPSMTHATAAAMLRNGYLSYHDDNKDPNNITKYAFDLSSARVRAARQVFEELRAGQPLGAIFGYRFERALQDNYPVSLGLNAYRFALRNYFPLVANKAGGTTTVPTSQVPFVAARNVVDGLGLWRAIQPGGVGIPFATATDLPRPNTPAFNAIMAEINRLGDAIDGVSDLNVGEGILQLIRGNVTNASGNLDSLARGARPPDPQMALSQRGGVPATHRTALLFSGANKPTSPGPNWPAATPRANAEPVLDAWAGGILGDPKKLTAKVTLVPIDPKTATTTTVTVTLDTLGLRPLDIVAIARVPVTPNAASLLDRRIGAKALGSDTLHTVGEVAYQPAAGPGSIPQVMELARAIGALIGGARALGSDDLTTAFDAPDARTSTETSNIMLLNQAGGLVARAQAAAGALAPIITALSGTTGLVAALTQAAAFMPDAFPPAGATDASLAVSIAPAILAQLQNRADDATKAATPAATNAAGLAAQQIAVFKAVFGKDFLALPTFDPPNVAELDQSLAGTATLFPPTSPPGGNDPAVVPAQFFQQAAQVYEGLGRLRTLSLYLGALSLPPLRLDVAQLPFSPTEQWIGLPFAGDPPSPGRLSLLLFSPGTARPSADDSWQGIVVQDFVEVIPNATEETGLAFHYDNPGAEAPQAVLVVPPTSTGTSWQQNDVWATLSETLDLAKIRAVDLEIVPRLGQFLPAVFMPQNTANATISTNWTPQIRVRTT